MLLADRGYYADWIDPAGDRLQLLRYESHATSSKIIWDVLRGDMPDLKARLKPFRRSLSNWPRSIHLEIEILRPDLRKRSVRHHLVDRLVERRAQFRILLAQPDGDAVA